MKEKIAIIVPSRGLVFTKVLAGIEKERQGLDVKVYYSDHLPIPDGHNSLTRQALSDGATQIIYVEEDTVPPTGAFEKLLASIADIACIDYGVSGWGCVTRSRGGEILWCGLGCTRVSRRVFEAMEEPYFRVDRVLRLNDMTWQELPKQYIETKNYGSLDIWFFTKAKKLGFQIEQIEGECDHLQLIRLGEKGINHGIHEIALKPRIEKKQIL